MGEELVLQDDAGTAVGKTLTLHREISFTVQAGFSSIPFLYTPGSGILTHLRGVGVVQLQRLTDQGVPAETFALRAATLGSQTFP